MRNFTVTVLAVLAVLLLAIGSGTAHGSNDAASDHNLPENASADEWATWMEQHMTEHMGTEAATLMQERMGMTYEEMGEHMASHQSSGMMSGGMSGMGATSVTVGQTRATRTSEAKNSLT